MQTSIRHGEQRLGIALQVGGYLIGRFRPQDATTNPSLLLNPSALTTTGLDLGTKKLSVLANSTYVARADSFAGGFGLPGATALSGGIGTIYGAILGALIMQSLQSGMAMVGVESPLQNIVVGSVLVLAVLIDLIYRRRVGGK